MRMRCVIDALSEMAIAILSLHNPQTQKHGPQTQKHGLTAELSDRRSAITQPDNITFRPLQ